MTRSWPLGLLALACQTTTLVAVERDAGSDAPEVQGGSGGDGGAQAGAGGSWEAGGAAGGGVGGLPPGGAGGRAGGPAGAAGTAGSGGGASGTGGATGGTGGTAGSAGTGGTGGLACPPGCAQPIDNGDCTETVCQAGACVVRDRAEGAACSRLVGPGQCRSGSCCTGCWDAATDTCVTATTVNLCGDEGAACQSCDDQNDCTIDRCEARQCQNQVAAEYDRCEGGAGQCESGVCTSCGDYGLSCCLGWFCGSAELTCATDLTCKPITCGALGGYCCPSPNGIAPPYCDYNPNYPLERLRCLNDRCVLP